MPENKEGIISKKKKKRQRVVLIIPNKVFSPFKSKKLSEAISVLCILNDAKLNRFTILLPKIGILSLFLPILTIYFRV